MKLLVFALLAFSLGCTKGFTAVGKTLAATSVSTTPAAPSAPPSQTPPPPVTIVQPPGVTPPTIVSVKPNTGSPNISPYPVIAGTNFESGAEVLIGGVKAQNTSQNDCGTTCIVFQPPNVTTTGFVDVEVINPDGGAAILKNGWSYPIPEPTASGPGFPRTAIMPIAGDQSFPQKNWALLAQYDVDLIGGAWETWRGANNTSKEQVIGGIKGIAKTGRVSPLTKIFQYVIAQTVEINGGTTAYPVLWDGIANNHWWLMDGSSISYDSNFNANGVDFTHYAGTDSAGHYPMQWFAQYAYNTYVLGKGNSYNAAPDLDGIYIDNAVPFPLLTGDWLHNGHTEGYPGNSQVDAAIQQGNLDFASTLKAIDSKMLTGANESLGQAQELGVDFSSYVGKFDYTMEQFLFSDQLSYAYDYWGGFKTAMQAYSAQLSSKATYVVPTNVINQNDYQYFRYSYAAMTMDNGYPQYGFNGTDCASSGDSSTFAQFDEMWGGTLNKHWWLGQPLANSLGATWSSGKTPWQRGTYRRDFDNGIVIVNPKGNGTQTVTFETTYYHIRGTQDSSVNNGQATTSVTLKDADGIFLSRTPVP